jgi:thiamine monophosphate kinase
MKTWFCPWMKMHHVGTYIFGGSLADLAAVGASATADVGAIRKK